MGDLRKTHALGPFALLCCCQSDFHVQKNTDVVIIPKTSGKNTVHASLTGSKALPGMKFQSPV